MFDFHQKRRLRMFVTSRYVQGVLLFVAVLIGLSAYERYTIASDMRERWQQVEREAAALEARKTKLESDVRYLSEERGIEAEMRRQFDVVKEGERVVVIVDPEVESEIKAATSSISKEAPWYQFWR